MSDRWVVTNIRDFMEKATRCGMVFKAVGNPKGSIIIFYDMYCPGCALMETDLGDYFKELRNKGIDIIYVDFPVHKVDMLHAKARVIYKRNPDDFLKLIDSVYGDMINKGNLVKDFDVNDAEAKLELENVKNCKLAAQSIGVKGTPTVVIAKYGRETATAVFGYLGPQEIMDLVTRELF
ncbi:hypothetical protein GCM10007981_14370 [Thermocladium modestius]|uniref:Thioredoxin-like fold domain-containing protein n=1 Tax=Thermocladium modestius TaxID=62609 RepID=A0A830GXG0_9CREN|nr:thioredoxin domain-containing protein [Thermocladium modestius]GGP21660.1 hypothetical protein GCM10007981_14370 [Thermocladium modestius]